MKKNTLGAWLKAQRRKHDYTQWQVEQAIGVDHSQYSKWENGHNRPEPESRARFHEFFGTDEDELVGLGILETYETLDGQTHYIYADHLTSGDRAAEAAHRAFEGRTITPDADDPRSELMALLAGASDAEVRKVIQIVTILVGAVGVNRETQGGPLEQMGGL